MRPEAFERIDVAAGGENLPLRSVHCAARASSLMHLISLSCLAAAVVGPQLWLAGYAVLSDDIRPVILGRPLIAFQLAVAILFWVGLFAWPLRRLYTRLMHSRSVEITSDSVSVAESRSFASTTWTAPLQSYTGIAHHIRSSLAGTRHELVLVHPDAARSVLLMTAAHLSDGDISRMTRLLNLPQIAAGALYRPRQRQGFDAKRMVWQALPA
jgi:hypothetical protein